MRNLRQLFVRVHRRYTTDRHADELDAFAGTLITVGYSAKCAREHVHHVQQVLRRIGSAPNAPLELDSLTRAFAACARRSPVPYRRTLRVYLSYLRQRGRLAEGHAEPNGRSKVRDDFLARLSSQRGFKPSTIDGYRLAIDDYFSRVLRPHEEVHHLRAGMLESYVAERASSLSRGVLRGSIRCIRAFLWDCIDRGLVPTNADAFDQPRAFRDEKPPRALSWTLIEQLLASIDRSDPVGARDHLILHLMAYYGLRPGEVGGLTCASINWDAATLTVFQAKTASTLILPLHARTLSLLRAYYKRDRPATSCDAVFLTAHAPVRPMSKFALSAVFKTRARRSGLPIADASSYALRHSFAMRLFDRGVGMKAIGDLMGHRSLVSTSVYIRLQADRLRGVALPVPGSEEARVSCAP